jgi:hypothetical protein
MVKPVSENRITALHQTLRQQGMGRVLVIKTGQLQNLGGTESLKRLPNLYEKLAGFISQKFNIQIVDILSDVEGLLPILAADPSFMERISNSGGNLEVLGHTVVFEANDEGATVSLLKNPENMESATKIAASALQDLRQIELKKMGNPADAVLDHIKAIRSSGFMPANSQDSVKLSSLFNQIKAFSNVVIAVADGKSNESEIFIQYNRILETIRAVEVFLPIEEARAPLTAIEAIINEYYGKACEILDLPNMPPLPPQWFEFELALEARGNLSIEERTGNLQIAAAKSLILSSRERIGYDRAKALMDAVDMMYENGVRLIEDYQAIIQFLAYIQPKDCEFDSEVTLPKSRLKLNYRVGDWGGLSDTVEDLYLKDEANNNLVILYRCIVK